MRAISVLRHKIIATIIQYNMSEIQGSDGCLIVVLPVRLAHAGRLACVFVDGMMAGEFQTLNEAARYARSLAQGRYPGSQEAPMALAEG